MLEKPRIGLNRTTASDLVAWTSMHCLATKLIRRIVMDDAEPVPGKRLDSKSNKRAKKIRIYDRTNSVAALFVMHQDIRIPYALYNADTNMSISDVCI